MKEQIVRSSKPVRELTTLRNINLPPTCKAAITEFRNEILKRHRKKIKKLILYGSAARGEVNEDSDIDLLIVWEGKRMDAFHKLRGIAIEILLKYGEFISMHPMTPTHYRFLSRLNTQFIRNVKEGGLVLA